jgi:hypothetical protein
MPYSAFDKVQRIGHAAIVRAARCCSRSAAARVYASVFSGLSSIGLDSIVPSGL